MFQFVEEDGEVEGKCHKVDADVPLEYHGDSPKVRLRGLTDADCRVLSLQSRSLYGRHLSTSFLDPVFGAMMKQACRQTLKSFGC